MKIDYKHKSALITGGSSGIGFAIAERLVKLGANVWILARNPERLAAAAARLEPLCIMPDQQIHTLRADISNPDQVNQAVAQMIDQTGTPDLVINNAGIAYPGYFETLDNDIFRQTIEINYLGMVYVTKAVIPGMIARKSGHIVNVSSLAGLMGFFGYTAYGASKYAVRGFSDALRVEMKPHGIRVSIVFPTDTETPQLIFENQYKPAELREIASGTSIMQPETVAEAVLNGIKHNRYMIIPGVEGNLMHLAERFFGRLVYPIMDILVAQAKRKING